MKIYESGRDEGLRGFLLLPKIINELTSPIIPAKIPIHFEDYDYHMFCIAYEGNKNNFFIIFFLKILNHKL
jgi:hypothetical protein